MDDELRIVHLQYRPLDERPRQIRDRDCQSQASVVQGQACTHRELRGAEGLTQPRELPGSQSCLGIAGEGLQVSDDLHDAELGHCVPRGLVAGEIFEVLT